MSLEVWGFVALAAAAFLGICSFFRAVIPDSLVALLIVGAVVVGVLGLYGIHVDSNRREATIVAHMKSRYGAAPVGVLNWNGKTLLDDGGGTDTTMIRFDTGKVDNCVVTGNTYDNPLLVCHGTESHRLTPTAGGR